MTERYVARPSGTRLIQGRPSDHADTTAPTYLPYAATASTEPGAAVHPKVRGEQIKLLAYALATVVISALTEPLWLATALFGVILLAGRDAPTLLRRAILATLAFSAVVSLAYIVQTVWISGTIPWKWLWSVNLRVLVMALLTFVFIRRTNLFAALAFSRRLSFMLVLAVSQSLGLRRTLDDFRLAMHSRGLRRAGLRDRYRAAAHAAGWLLDRALANAHESAQALQSRGLFR
ncbi:MAG: ABC transporter permease [Hydrogenophilales bacterium]|nr:ABC transporter permease [Hydrogenophilales bacterium]